MARATILCLFVCIGVSLAARKWPSGRVPFTVNSGLDEAAIAGAHRAITQNVPCIKFVSKTPSDKMFLTYKSGQLCMATLGAGPNAYVSLANYCRTNVNTIAFETTHVLGLNHGRVNVGTPPSAEDYNKLKQMYGC